MTILISHKNKREFKEFLHNENIDFIETIDNPNIDLRISDHPDLSVFVLDDKNIVIDENLFSYYEKIIKDKKLIKGESTSKTYPKDAIYNIVRFKNYYIHNDFTEKSIKKYFFDNKIIPLKVKQGYTRCSSIVLKESILTSDYGMYKKLKDKINIILLNEEKIELDGFEKGFLGGTCGLVDDKLIFNGNIENLASYDIIKTQCEKENIRLMYPSIKLLDTGSLMNI